MVRNWKIEVEKIIVRPVAVPLVTPFQTSFGTEDLHAAVLIELHTKRGAIGWGEVTATWFPGYSYETVQTALHVLEDFLVPALMKSPSVTVDGEWKWLSAVRGHPLAKHGLISAILTAAAAEQKIPFSKLLQNMSGVKSTQATVDVGVSLGIQPTIRATLERIEQHLAEGYKRIKLKIKPGWDVVMLRGVRAVFPDIMLMADANSAYTLNDLDLLKQMDEFNLLMIEQPLAHDDIYQHSLLQKELQTPICLDESIHTLGDAQLAHHLGACKIINLKPQRVGGLFEAIKIHNFCHENKMPVWVGGMLETGIGRSISLALASLPGITLPSDLSETRRYYDPDLSEPPFVLESNSSQMRVPTDIGLGVEVQMDRIEAAEVAYQARAATLFS